MQSSSEVVEDTCRSTPGHYGYRFGTQLGKTNIFNAGHVGLATGVKHNSSSACLWFA
jgi:hypothetical protein